MATLGALQQRIAAFDAEMNGIMRGLAWESPHESGMELAFPDQVPFDWDTQVAPCLRLIRTAPIPEPCEPLADQCLGEWLAIRNYPLSAAHLLRRPGWDCGKFLRLLARLAQVYDEAVFDVAERYLRGRGSVLQWNWMVTMLQRAVPRESVAAIAALCSLPLFSTLSKRAYREVLGVQACVSVADRRARLAFYANLDFLFQRDRPTCARICQWIAQDLTFIPPAHLADLMGHSFFLRVSVEPYVTALARFLHHGEQRPFSEAAGVLAEAITQFRTAATHPVDVPRLSMLARLICQLVSSLPPGQDAIPPGLLRDSAALMSIELPGGTCNWADLADQLTSHIWALRGALDTLGLGGEI
jgi:hypothetical protein